MIATPLDNAKMHTPLSRAHPPLAFLASSVALSSTMKNAAAAQAADLPASDGRFLDAQAPLKPQAQHEPSQRQRGGQTVYTPELGAEICRRLKATGSLRRACAADGMPAESTVREWVMDDRGGFAAQYARAREVGYQRLAEDVLEIADDGTNDTYLDEDGEERKNRDVIERSRLRVDTRKWLLARVLPKIYGDKIALTGADGGPLQIQAVRFAEVVAAAAVPVLIEGATHEREQLEAPTSGDDDGK